VFNARWELNLKHISGSILSSKSHVMFEAVSRKEFLILEARFRSLASQSEICDRQRGTKFGHTLSSRNVSSCDVTRAVGM